MALPRVQESITGEIDTLFDRLWNDWLTPSYPVRFEPLAYTAPACDLYEKDGTFVIEMAVPGYKNEDINVEVNGTLLTVTGKLSEEKRQDEAKYHYRQIRRGNFARTVTLPQEIDQATMKATIEQGILKITAKSTKPVTAKKIPVTTGG